MLTSQKDTIRSYIDYAISLAEKDLQSISLFLRYGPSSIHQELGIQHISIALDLQKIRKQKRQLVLDSEILLLSVIDHFHDQTELDNIVRACTIICTENVIPEKYITLLRQPELECHIRTIVQHLDFVDTMSWFV